MEIKINPVFRDAIPPLTADEFKNLEESILEYGCRDPLVLWGNTLVDGHNRYKICTDHDIPFKTVQMDFKDESHATYWIIKNQLSRRNIPPGTRIILAKKLEPMLREMARENLIKGADSTNITKSAKEDNAFVQMDKPEIKPIDVRKEIAEAAKVSTGTLARFDKVQKERPDLVEKIVSDEMTINKAYTLAKEESVPAKEVIKEEDNGKDMIKRETLIKDIWKLLDAIDKFSSKHEAEDFACLLNTPEVERSMITGKIQSAKKILTSVSNGFSAIRG